jgi:iron complex outermembrane receptor protein
MKRLALAIAATVAITTASVVMAEDEKAVKRMDEVVVTATKTEESIKEVPNSVIVKDSIDIEDTGAKTVGQLLSNEQGIDLRTRGDYAGATEEIHIRGMGADGTQVLVNGVVVNSPSLGSANLNGLPMNNIERVEVVKGAGSLLYGTSAMGGIVNIITKRPEKDGVTLNAKAGYGTNSTFEFSAENGMYITKNFGYYLTAGKQEGDGFRSNSDLDHKDASLNLVYEKDDLLDMSLYADYVDREMGRPGVRPPAGTADFYVGNVKLYDRESSNLLNRQGDENMSVSLRIKSRPFDKAGINFSTSYLDMENYNYNRYYSSYPVAGIPGSKTWVTNKVFTVEANTDIEPVADLKLLLGAEFKRYDWENRTINLDETGAVSGIPAGASEELDTKGYYGEGQYRACDYFKMIAGLRLTDHSEFGKKYVPRYGVIITPHKDTAIKMNYGKHYNAPTPNDLFWPFEDWGWGSGAQGNIGLRPETGKHMDAGIEQGFLDNKLSFNLTYYKWDINDKIRWVPDENYFYTPQNLDKYTGDGYEAGLNYTFNESLSLNLDYTYSDAKEEQVGGVTRKARYTADDYLKFGVNYFSQMGLGVSAVVRYTGERPGSYALDTDVNPEVMLESYYTVDLNINQPLYDNWRLALNLSNLFDKEYDTYTESFRDQSTSVRSNAFYPGAGRSIFLSVSYEY